MSEETTRHHEPLDLAALAAASVPAEIHLGPSNEERKAQAIFNVLTVRGKLTKLEIMAATDFSHSQFRMGWSHLRRSLGSLCVVENHGEASTYHLTNQPSLEAEKYRLWQDKQIYRRLMSLRMTLRQQLEIALRTDQDDGDSLRTADYGLADAVASMKLELRRAGRRAEVPEEEVEAYLQSVSIS